MDQYRKDCHMVLISFPAERGPYGDDECIFTRSDEKRETGVSVVAAIPQDKT
jgi:hypothetical protein